MSENKKQRNGLSKALKTFYGVGDFGFSFMSNIETYYFNYFLTNVAKFSAPVVTVVATVSSLIDACLSWIYGVIINSIKPMKWGRYRSWLLVAPWLVPFLYVFQFIRIGPEIVAAIIVVLGFVTSHIVWNIPWVANMSMINVAAKTPEERMALSSSRTMWNNIARVCYSYVGPAVVTFFAGVLGEDYGYAACAFAFGALMAAGYFAHFKMFDGYEESAEAELARMQAQKAAQDAAKAERKKKEGTLLQTVLANPYLLGLMVSELGRYTYSFVSSGIATYYFIYVAKDEGLTATFILISNLLGIAAGYLSRHIANKFSARGTMILAYIGIVVLLGVAFLLYENIWLVIVLMSLGQFCLSLTNACGPALYADCAIYSEWKTGRNATATIMGLGNVPLKAGVVCRALLINAALALGGFTSGLAVADVTPAIQRGIAMGFTVFPAVAVAIGLVIMLFFYRLTKERVNECSAEIARRKAQQK